MLVLASTSRHRARLLARLGVSFEVAAPDFDERGLDLEFPRLGPERFATMLARGKAESATSIRPDAFVLAADQLAVIDGELLHKPADEAAAVAQLLRLRGRSHELVTAVVLREPGGHTYEHVDRHVLSMRTFGRDEARAYVMTHRPLECVGSYRIEDAGIALFTRIEGSDPTAIEGLPLVQVAEFLRSAGILPVSDAKEES